MAVSVSILVLRRDSAAPFQTMLGAYKRIMLEKGDHDLPSPESFRPVDVYSCITRLISSSQVAQLKQWIHMSLHDFQFGMKGGTLKVAAKTALAVDGIAQAKMPFWGFSLDFSKLFNSLCPDIAARIANRMGLHWDDALSIVTPIQQSKGFWRLPNQEVCPPTRRQRGLPQGLAGSVLMAEIMLAVLIYRLNSINGLEAYAYIDDIHMLTLQKDQFKKGLDIIRKFTWDFALELAALKSKVWGFHRSQAREIAEQYGFAYTEVVTTMGASWPTSRKSCNNSPPFPKEKSRIEEAQQRLTRIQHLRAKPNTKIGAIAMACLPLTNYLPAPSIALYRPLRAAIRRACGQVHGAWEICAWSLSPNSIDPETGWVVALLQLWFECAILPEGPLILDAVRRGFPHSRLSAILRWCHAKGWHLTSTSLVAGDSLIPFSQPWKRIRIDIIAELQSLALHDLAKRRPNTFDGIEVGGMNVPAHKRLALKLNPHEFGTLQRFWAGAVMTRERRAKYDHMISPQCDCGAPIQSVKHLLWDCELVEPHSIEMQSWRASPP